MMLQPGDFIFNNINSTDLGNCKIQLRPEIPTPKRKVEFLDVPGVDGNPILDDEAYENVTITLEIIFKAQSNVRARNLRERLTHVFDSGGYVPLELYFDPDRIYYVKTVNGPNFRLSGHWPEIVLFSIEFSVKPFKEYKVSFNQTLVTGSNSIFNPSYFYGKPIITLNGVGDMKLIVNGDEFNFKDVDDHIVVDSTVEAAYKIIGELADGRNNKMFTPYFPLLSPGNNTISYTGATSAKIEGRWATLVG